MQLLPKCVITLMLLFSRFVKLGLQCPLHKVIISIKLFPLNYKVNYLHYRSDLASGGQSVTASLFSSMVQDAEAPFDFIHSLEKVLQTQRYLGKKVSDYFVKAQHLTSRPKMVTAVITACA